MKELFAWLPVALLGLLAGCSAPSGTDQAIADARATRSTGARLYDFNCAPCHQDDAHGIQAVYPSLVGSPVVLGDPGELARWVFKGQRPATRAASRYPTAMPLYEWMKPDDAASLLTYLRANFGNAAPAVDAATVAQALGPK